MDKKGNMKATKFFKSYIGCIVLIFTIILPFVVAIIPVIPYIMTENGYWMLGMILTFPLCVVSMMWLIDDGGLERMTNYFFED